MPQIVFFLLNVVFDTFVGFIKILLGTAQQVITLIILLAIFWINACLSKETNYIDFIIFILPILFMYSQSKGGR